MEKSPRQRGQRHERAGDFPVPLIRLKYFHIAFVEAFNKASCIIYERMRARHVWACRARRVAGTTAAGGT